MASQVTGNAITAGTACAFESLTPRPPYRGMDAKRCTTCRFWKSLSEFHADASKPDLHRANCKVCHLACDSNSPEVKKNRKIRQRANGLVVDARKRAKKQTPPWKCDLDVNEIEDRIRKGRCELTGIEFDLSIGTCKKRNFFAPSLDRIDSEAGYEMSNIRVVLAGLNIMMNTWGLRPILEMTDAIRRNQYEG